LKGAECSGVTGISCTDEQRRWNAGTKRNHEQKSFFSFL